MAMIAKGRRHSHGHRHVAEPPAFRRRDVALPVGSLDAQLPFSEIDIAPFERHHLAAPQPGFPTQERNTFKTVNTLFTVFGARSFRWCLSCCTVSVVIVSSRLCPNIAIRCTCPILSLAA